MKLHLFDATPKTESPSEHGPLGVDHDATVTAEYEYQIEQWIIDIGRDCPYIIRAECPDIGRKWIRASDATMKEVNNCMCDKYKEEYHSPQTIIDILHSIDKVSLDQSGSLEIMFVDEHWTESIHSFIPGSFTRKLLELIEEHLSHEKIGL